MSSPGYVAVISPPLLGVRYGRPTAVRRLLKFDLPPTNAVVMLYAASPTLRFVAADLLFLLNSSAALTESGRSRRNARAGHGTKSA